MKKCNKPDKKVKMEEEKEKIDDDGTIHSENFCLFCNLRLGSLEDCLIHMKRKHSFMILKSEQLYDLVGLLNCLGTEVLIQNECFFCTKQFDSYKQCQ